MAEIKIDLMSKQDKRTLYQLYFEKMYSIPELQAYFNNKYSYSIIKTTISEYLKSK